MWLETSKVEDLWQKVSIKNGVELKSFAEAARSTATILDQVYGLGMARADMFGNVDTLLRWCVQRPYSSLDELLVEEIANKDRSTVTARIGDKKTVACATLWLLRTLEFIRLMILSLCDDRELSLTNCVKIAYAGSLSKHHNQIMRMAFSVGGRLIPDRMVLLQKLHGANEKKDLFPRLRKLEQDVRPIMEHLNQLYMRENIVALH